MVSVTGSSPSGVIVRVNEPLRAAPSFFSAALTVTSTAWPAAPSRGDTVYHVSPEGTEAVQSWVPVTVKVTLASDDAGSAASVTALSFSPWMSKLAGAPASCLTVTVSMVSPLTLMRIWPVRASVVLFSAAAKSVWL